MAPGFEVVVDDLALREFLHAEVAPALSEIVGPKIAAAARSRAPHRSGRLLGSIGWAAEDGATQVYAVFYDLFLERPARQIGAAQRTLIDAMDDVPSLL
jgi:hypothetical protein